MNFYQLLASLLAGLVVFLGQWEKGLSDVSCPRTHQQRLGFKQSPCPQDERQERQEGVKVKLEAFRQLGGGGWGIVGAFLSR